MTNTVERMTITLTTEMAHAVKGAVNSGSYASSSEIIREALRDWQHKRQLQQQEFEMLKADVQKGITDYETGQINDFDAKRIIAKGKARKS